MSAKVPLVHDHTVEQAAGSAAAQVPFLEVADMLAAHLEQLGIEYVFGVPGGAIAPIYNALARSQRRGGRRPMVARHDGFRADGNPNVPAECITGDGSMLMNGREVSVAVAGKLTVIYVVLNELGRQTGEVVAVLFLDLGRFKYVNDTLGNEFTVALANINSAGAAAQNICRMMAPTQEPC